MMSPLKIKLSVLSYATLVEEKMMHFVLSIFTCSRHSLQYFSKCANCLLIPSRDKEEHGAGHEALLASECESPR